LNKAQNVILNSNDNTNAENKEIYILTEIKKNNNFDTTNFDDDIEEKRRNTMTLYDDYSKRKLNIVKPNKMKQINNNINMMKKEIKDNPIKNDLILSNLKREREKSIKPPEETTIKYFVENFVNKISVYNNNSATKIEDEMQPEKIIKPIKLKSSHKFIPKQEKIEKIDNIQTVFHNEFNISRVATFDNINSNNRDNNGFKAKIELANTNSSIFNFQNSSNKNIKTNKLNDNCSEKIDREFRKSTISKVSKDLDVKIQKINDDLRLSSNFFNTYNKIGLENLINETTNNMREPKEVVLNLDNSLHQISQVKSDFPNRKHTYSSERIFQTIINNQEEKKNISHSFDNTHIKDQIESKNYNNNYNKLEGQSQGNHKKAISNDFTNIQKQKITKNVGNIFLNTKLYVNNK